MTEAWLNREEYPFESNYFNVPGGRLHYLDEGKSDHVVVMVHGNPTWSYSFRHLVKGLSDTYRCIAVDHLGFGLSDKPENWDYLPESHADNLERLLAALDVKSATFVVEDWGGPIGLSYALKYPNKVKSVVIMNTWLWPVDGDPHYERFSGFMGGAVGRFLIKNFNFFARVVVKQAYGDKSKLTKEIHQHYLKPLGTPAERKGCSVFPKEIIGSSAWLKTLWEMRASIAGKPSLVLWGKKDIAFRDQELAVWKEELFDAEVHEFAEVGHFVQEELGQQFVDLTRSFIDKHCAAV